MNLTFKFLTTIALLITLNIAASAQRGGGKELSPEDMAEKQTTQMVEQLSLDAMQTIQVKEINLTYANKMQEAKVENDGNREAIKLIGGAIEKEKTAELQQVLTESQFKTYEELLAKKSQGGKRGGKGGRGGRGSRGGM